MGRPDKPPYHTLADWAFVDADTWRVIEAFKMREFYEWDEKSKRYALVRSYALDMEATVNPGFKG